MSKNISRYFKRTHLTIYLLSQLKNFTPGVKILGLISKRKNQDFLPKSENSHESQNIETFFREIIFGGRGEISTYENVSICNDYCVLLCLANKLS